VVADGVREMSVNWWSIVEVGVGVVVGGFLN
jgi:hypothetical protein